MAIEGSSATVRVDEARAGYAVHAKIPWSALGGRERFEAEKGVRFNFKIRWSDRTGGSIFRELFWQGETPAAFGTLRLGRVP